MSLALSEIPKTGFVARRRNYVLSYLLLVGDLAHGVQVRICPAISFCTSIVFHENIFSRFLNLCVFTILYISYNCYCLEMHVS